MRSVVRFNPGRNQLIEAVETDSGVMLVEFLYTNKFPDPQRGYLQQRKLAVFLVFDRSPVVHNLDHTYVDEMPK